MAATRFQLQLPLTLSVVRTLFVEIGGEPYAFPFAHIFRVVKPAPQDEIQSTRGATAFQSRWCSVSAWSRRTRSSVANASALAGSDICRSLWSASVTIASAWSSTAFIGGRELVVQPLDPRLGKVKDISAAALMEDGSPTLIVDVEDMVRSMEKLAHCRSARARCEANGTGAAAKAAEARYWSSTIR